MFLTSLLATSLLAPLVGSVYLPKPRGPYNVGFTQHVFNHTTPSDPSSPTGTGTFFLCSIYYPTLDSFFGSTRVPYFDPVSAEIWGEVFRRYPSDLLSIETTLQYEAAVLSKKENKHLSKLPTLVFSPGGGANAFMYTSLLSELASQGYTILALDHPGEAPYLTLPGNDSGVVGWDIYMPYNDSIIQSVYEFRTGDILALLSPEGFPALVEQSGAPFNTRNYGAFGHSVGGAASTGAADRLDNIVAVANIDGGFFGDSVNASLDGRPFFMMASENHTEESDPTWVPFVEKYAAEGGWLDYLRVKGAAHLAFSDIPLWTQLLQPIPNTTAIVNLGTVPGDRIDKLLKTYVSAFWEFVIGKKYNAGLLDGPSKDWPEVWFNKTVRS